MSRIGKKPVELPSGVTATVSGQTIEVKGPKGTRSFTATDDVTLAVADGAVTVFSAPDASGRPISQAEQWSGVPGDIARVVNATITVESAGVTHTLHTDILGRVTSS